MEIHIKIVGCLLILLAMLHGFLPKYLNWRKELSSLRDITKQIVYVHTFFIAFMVLLMGMFCLYATEDIVNTRLGHVIAFGLFNFWFARLIFQLFVYSPKTWKGKIFETSVHIFFSVIWSYFSVVFFLVFLSRNII